MDRKFRLRVLRSSSAPPIPGFPLTEAGPVPRDAYLEFYTLFSLAESDFFKKWQTFAIVIQYNNSTVRHEFDRQWVIDQINQSHPESRPHVSKRQL